MLRLGRSLMQRWVVALGLSVLCWGAAMAQDGGVPGTPAVPPTPPVTPAVPSAARDTEMPILPGDVLAVRVLGEPELTGSYPVWPDGTIEMPWVDPITVQNLLPRQIRDKIVEAYKPDLLLDPKVIVDIATYGPRPVWVYGAVAKPGPIEWHLARTITKALVQAGQFLPNADMGRVVLRREGETVAVLDLEGWFRHGEPINNVDLLPHDEILVPEKGMVYLVGRVSRPGPLSRALAPTLREAIIAGGGVSEAAGLNRTVIIRGEETITTDLGALLDGRDLTGNIALVDGDVIVVPPNRVTVVGDVQKQGIMELPPGSCLRDAVMGAGGVQPSAVLSRVRLVRGDQEIAVDARGLFGEESGPAQNPELQPQDIIIVPRGVVYVAGEVQSQGIVPASQATSLLRLVEMARPLETADKESVVILRGGQETVVSVADLLQPGGKGLDVPLLPDDHVIFPRREREVVYLVGAWRRPGPVEYEQAKTLLQALAYVGEDLEWQSVDLTAVTLVRDGTPTTLNLEPLIYKADLSKDIDLLPNDILVAPANRDNFVYVVGEVNKPGPVPYEMDMTLSDALMKAGGYREYADIESIRVTRARAEKPEGFHVNFRQWVAHGDAANNPVLQPGDIVRVVRKDSIRAREWLGSLGIFLSGIDVVSRIGNLF